MKFFHLQFFFFFLNYVLNLTYKLYRPKLNGRDIWCTIKNIGWYFLGNKVEKYYNLRNIYNKKSKK